MGYGFATATIEGDGEGAILTVDVDEAGGIS